MLHAPSYSASAKEQNICTAKRKILSKSLWGQILLIRPASLPRLNLFKDTQLLIIGWLDWPLSSRLNKIKLWDSSHHVSPWRRTKNYYRLSDKLVNLTPFALELSPHILWPHDIVLRSNYIWLLLLRIASSVLDVCSDFSTDV